MQIERIQKARLRRKLRVKKKLFGTPERPRLSVFRSNRHIYAQIIDDMAGVTLVSVCSQAGPLKEALDKTGNKAAAEAVGKELAKKAIQVGIKCVKFDRSRYKYHGRIKSLADGARKAGLAF
jgi:large subunit ribosomal protein L18